MMHEAQLHENNCFITLTYDDEHLPHLNSLVLKHFQDFMKRLRRKYPYKIRLFHCGEYGDINGRPHYHACLFGHDFMDKYLWSERDSICLYRSVALEQLWPLGFSTIGQVTFDSAAYCARYITKKVNGKRAERHYSVWDYEETGEFLGFLLPEYCTQSRGGRTKEGENLGGLGREWYKKFKSDVFPADEVIMRGYPMRPPKFYDGLYEIEDQNSFGRVKRTRKKNASKHAADQTPARLKVRETVHKTKLKLLPRSV